MACMANTGADKADMATTRALRFIIAISSAEAVAAVAVVGWQATELRILNVNTILTERFESLEEAQSHLVTYEVTNTNIGDIHPPTSISRISVTILLVSRISDFFSLEGEEEVRGIIQRKAMQKTQILNDVRVRVIQLDKAKQTRIQIKLDALSHRGSTGADDLDHQRTRLTTPYPLVIRCGTLWLGTWAGHQAETPPATTKEPRDLQRKLAGKLGIEIATDTVKAGMAIQSPGCIARATGRVAGTTKLEILLTIGVGSTNTEIAVGTL